MKKNVVWHIVRLCLLPAVVFSPGALADCMNDFERDNAYKPSAGAYRMHERQLPLTLLNGEWLPSFKQETINLIYEVVPPNAVRIISDAPFGKVGVIVINDKGWVRTGKDKAWEPLDAASSKDAIDKALTSYLNSDDLRGMTCSKEERDGRSMRVYRYNVPNPVFSILREAVTAYFDDRTGLFVNAEIEGGTERQKTITTLGIAFDNTIKIQPPGAVD